METENVEPNYEDPNSSTIYMQQTADKGRGVFARQRILRDQVIERAPVIVVPKTEWAIMEETVLSNYVFDWGEHDEHAAVALGYVSIYNHSYRPNASLNELLDENVIEVVALQDIEAGEEIFVNYNGQPDDREELWFDVVEDRQQPHS
jgi:SET domain-containing protein